MKRTVHTVSLNEVEEQALQESGLGVMGVFRRGLEMSNTPKKSGKRVSTYSEKTPASVGEAAEEHAVVLHEDKETGQISAYGEYGCGCKKGSTMLCIDHGWACCVKKPRLRSFREDLN